MAMAKRKLDIIQNIKYLLKTIFPSLLTASIILDVIMIIVPRILLKIIFSFKKIKLKIIRKTVDSCFSILKLEGSKPYLASMFSLSVAA